MDSYEKVCMENNIRSADELADVLRDYAKQASQLKECIEHFQTAVKPVLLGNGVWVCPSCNHRVNARHSHCHWCGKKLRGGNNAPGKRRTEA